MPAYLSGYEDKIDEVNLPIITNLPKSPISRADLSSLSVVKSGMASTKVVDNHALLTVKRLIVVVPNVEVDEAQLSRQIWNLASSYRLDILLVSMVKDTDDCMTATRRLTTVSAMTRDSHFKVEKQVVFSNRWDKVLRQYWQQMDMILCPAEITILNIFGNPVLLSQALSDRLKAPVYTFCGLYKPQHAQKLPTWLGKLPFWLGFILIVSIFFYFESDVDQLVHGWVGQILLVMLVIFEIGLINIWTLIAG